MATLEAFRSAVELATQEALDAGTYYNDQIKAFVIERVGDLDPAEDCRYPDIDRSSTDTFETWRERLTAAEAMIAAAPRGHYVLTRAFTGEHSTQQVIMSNGDGLAPGVRHDPHPTTPTWKSLVERMVGHEIYLARQAIERRRELAEDVEAIEAFSLVPEYSTKDLNMGGRVFSTGTISAVHSDTGMIDLNLTRRGSPNRMVTSIRAKDFVRFAGLERGLPPMMQL